MSQITFLLGAGISIPAGMPKTDDITSRILSGEGTTRTTDNSYYFNQKAFYTNDGRTDRYVSAVTSLLSIFYEHGSIYSALNGRAKPNYEDVYHILDQLCDEVQKEREGPVVHAFLNQVGPQLGRILGTFNIANGDSLTICGLFDQAKNYAKCVIWRLLHKEPSRLDHLQCLVDACRDDKLTRVTLATLNHDTILEKCLEENNVEFVDGLAQDKNGVRYWDHRVFEATASKTTLLKLHGSINWFAFQDEERIPRAAAFDGYPGDADDGSQRLNPQDPHPLVLVGSFNKEREYTEAVFFDLSYQFLRSLRATNRLVVAGYGWADKGINARIFEWMNSSPQNRVVVIEPYFDDLKRSRARYGAVWRFDEWLEKKRLFVIDEGIECVDWREIVHKFT